MAQGADELYKGSLLHKVFAVASILFLLGVVAMIIQDYTREWKGFQRAFNAFELEKTEKEIERAGRKIKEDELGALKKELAEEMKRFDERKKDFRAAQKALEDLDRRLYKVTQDYQIAKSYYDAAKYEYEEAVKHGTPTEDLKRKLEATESETAGFEHFKTDLEEERIVAKSRLDSFTQAQKTTQKSIDKLTLDRDQLRKKIKQLKPNLITALLNAPMLDFLQPTLKIKQIVLEDLYDDYYFAKVPKVDRCTTCHLAIDKPKGYDKAPQPFRAHPNLELFLGSTSLHPGEAFGCTTCHGGSGQDVTFTGAAHTPRSEEQKQEWIKKYGWHERHHWDRPMYPLGRVEAGCLKCHNAVQEIPRAPKLNEGRRLYRELGCFGCHETKGFEGLRKVGPSLERIGSKTDRGWAFRWVKNPLSYNPATKMPRFFGLSNAATPEREDVEIDAIVTYLFEQSKPVEFEESGHHRGDVDRGAELVKTVGCLGCHTIGDNAANSFGPNLSWVGSKVNRSWLVDWLRNPKHYWPETRMPNFRLSEQESLDVAEYLMSLRSEIFDQIAEPVIQADVLDEATLYELRLLLTQAEADQKMSQMDEKAKKLYLGERLIHRHGCFGCHSIPGFETAKPIGTNMSEEGSKPVDRFDFALLDIEHSREAWFRKKLKDPRSFDQGKVKRHEERLRMPKFNLTEAEIESLITHLTSLTKETVPLSKQHILNEREKDVEQGWRMVRELNCQGCHMIEGSGGNILSLYSDKSLGPPNITGEGKKVQSDWLFNFLRHPSTIRPWLKIRMPTFDFTNEEASTLAKFFHGLDSVKDAFQPDDLLAPHAEQVSAGRFLFDQLQCAKCHRYTSGMSVEGIDVSTLAPNLEMAKSRLRPEWIVEWLKDPEALMPGTRMPSFWPEGFSPAPEILNGDAEKQRMVVRDYLMRYQGEPAAG